LEKTISSPRLGRTKRFNPSQKQYLRRCSFYHRLVTSVLNDGKKTSHLLGNPSVVSIQKLSKLHLAQIVLFHLAMTLRASISDATRLTVEVPVAAKMELKIKAARKNLSLKDYILHLLKKDGISVR